MGVQGVETSATSEADPADAASDDQIAEKMSTRGVCRSLSPVGD